MENSYYYEVYLVHEKVSSFKEETHFEYVGWFADKKSAIDFCNKDGRKMVVRRGGDYREVYKNY